MALVACRFWYEFHSRIGASIKEANSTQSVMKMSAVDFNYL
jgi:hypothetical protein